MNKEFNMVRLIKNIRKQKIIFSESLRHPAVRQAILDDQRNCIDVDSPKSMGSSDDSQTSDYINKRKKMDEIKLKLAL